jgi:Domain of unknown function (DUF4394)
MSIRSMLAAGTVAMAAAPAAQAATLGVGYSLGNNGQTLVILGDLADPGTLSGKTITNADGVVLRLSELTVRPRTGELYGYSDADSTVYLVDPATGKAAAKGTLDNATPVPAVGFDFNPTIDRARIVSITDDNIVFNPDTNSFTVATRLFYATGDANEGADPNVFANAYTNSFLGITPPTTVTTVQYVIDSELDILATLANNAGTLTTVGSFFLNGSAFDLSDLGGFDILSLSEGNNTAIALLTSTMGQSLYSFSLTPDGSGRINLISYGDASTDFGLLRGLAVAPAAVPLPAAGLLLGAALAGLSLVRRRQRRRRV